MKVLSVRAYWLTVLISILCCVALYAVLAVMQLGAPTGLTGYTERYAVAQDRCAVKKEPKLLYGSGSSGFYGVRCEQLSRMIGRPAVNFGLHGGLGLRYLMDRVLAASAAGDVIVIAPEWENYHGPRFGEYACDYIMSRRPEYLKDLPLSLAIQLVVAAGPERIFSGLWSRLAHEPLSSAEAEELRGVNGNGDRVIMPEDVEQQSKFVKNLSADAPRWRTPSPQLAHDVDAFVAAAREKGVRIVAAFPPLCMSERIDEANLRAADDGMRTFWGERGVEVLGTIEDFMYKPSDAFDTPYHLGQRAASIHTVKLARLLLASQTLKK